MRPLQGYGPYELVDDSAFFGLASTTVRNEHGTCVARHPVARTSPRATVLLHGAAGSWTTWTPLLLCARDSGIELGDTVLLDLPGWGDAELSDGEQSIEAISSLVKETVESLGYTEWDVIGHSLGGFVALHLAATLPASVRSVGMVSGTTFSVMASVRHPLTKAFELPGFTGLWRVMQLLAALGPAGTAFVRGLAQVGLLRPLTAPLFRHWMSVPRSQGRALARELRPRPFVAAARATLDYDAEGLWSRITCAVRSTRGDRDVFVSSTDHARLTALIPGHVSVVVLDCGHFGAVERPAEVLVALGFLARAAV